LRAFLAPTRAAARSQACKLPVSTPHVRKPFARSDAETPYRERIKPFNFLLTAHIAKGGFPIGADKAHFLLVAPYEPDPQRWLKSRWMEVNKTKIYRVTTDRQRRTADPSHAMIDDYHRTLTDFRLHPEAKSLCPDGTPCDEHRRNSAGLLRRRSAEILRRAIEHIGKETNELKQVLGAQDEDELVQRYRPLDESDFDCYGVLLRAVPKPRIVDLTGVSPRTIEMLRKRRTVPRAKTQEALLEALRQLADDGHAFTFEAIEALDPVGIAAEVRVHASAGTHTKAHTLSAAREELAADYAARILAALSFLAL